MRPTVEDTHISKYLTYAAFIRSGEAEKYSLDNTPTEQHLENGRGIGFDIYDK